MLASAVETTLRRERVPILGALFRLGGDLELAEDALQEASARALEAWSRTGVPDRPGAWLQTVARNWLIDQLRARARQDRALQRTLDEPAPPEDTASRASQLELLFACCSTQFPRRTRATMALKTLLGLSTREIARAYVETESATAQRITRARRAIGDTSVATPTTAADRERSIAAFLEALYLLFNEGYLAAHGERLLRRRLAEEALSLATTATQLLPYHSETLALAAVFNFHLGRSDARTDEHGDLVPLEEQDRGRWDHTRFEAGEQLLARSITLMRDAGARSGPYQVQAAIAALHARAKNAEATDWLQIAALYRRLLELTPTPVVELNAAIALAMAGDLRGGLAWINALEKRRALEGYHLLLAVKADLLRRMGKRVQARRYYVKARKLAANDRESRYISRRIEELDAVDG